MSKYTGIRSSGVALVLLAMAFLLVVGQAGAVERKPVSVSMIHPVQGGLSGTDAGVLPAATRAVTVPRLTPAGAESYGAMKDEASYAPASGNAELLPVPAGPEPLTSDVATSFVGLDRPGAANNGIVFFPPDTIVAKSTTKVLEAVNSAVRMFSTVGAVAQTKDLNTFFGASTANGILFDPKVYYDRNAANRRFYVVALQQKSDPKVSRIWLAVSRSADPTNLDAANWCRYNLEGKRNISTADESWADYPGLGAGADALMITANQFTFSAENFTYAVIRVLNKTTLSNNAAACPSVPIFTFQASGTKGDGTAFTLQPAQHYSSPSSFTSTTNPAYLVSTVFGTSNIYRVWQIRNVAGGSPTLRSLNLTGAFTYSVQPNAAQSGSATLLDTGDNRMMQVAGIGNSLFAVHGTGCNFAGGAPESCARFVKITVGQAAGGALTASLAKQNTFGGGPGAFYFWPGIAANNRLQVVVPFHISSASSFLSSYWTMKDDAAATFESASRNTVGTCAQTLSGRTGDYIGAQTDPSDFTSFWVAGERATTLVGACQWQTQIQKIVPGELLPLPIAPD
jgi:hypothetical protein